MVSSSPTAVIADAQQYLQDTLGLRLNPVIWEADTNLPIYLQRQYEFWNVDVLDVPCLLAIDKAPEETSPTVVEKHLAQLCSRTQQPIIYVRASIQAYNRKRLIEQNIPFIVPGNQMYLPPLGIDLREYYRSLHKPAAELSPSTQAVLLHALLDTQWHDMSIAQLSSQLHYSAMTVSRAFNELEAHNLGESARRARERHFRLSGPKKQVWERAQPLLRDPARTRYYLNEEETHKFAAAPLAGLSALTMYSMLAAPKQRVVALSYDEWRALEQRTSLMHIPKNDPKALIVEVWMYDPKSLTTNDAVDPLSLYLTLRDSNDERIEEALEQVLAGISW